MTSMVDFDASCTPVLWLQALFSQSTTLGTTGAKWGGDGSGGAPLGPQHLGRRIIWIYEFEASLTYIGCSRLTRVT